MTVSELLAVLSNLPGELPVYLKSLGDFEKVMEIKIARANASMRHKERHVIIFGEYRLEEDDENHYYE